MATRIAEFRPHVALAMINIKPDED